MVYQLARPALFRLSPEKAHSLTLNTVRMLGRIKPPPRTTEPLIRLMGLTFGNRVGLAARLRQERRRGGRVVYSRLRSC